MTELPTVSPLSEPRRRLTAGALRERDFRLLFTGQALSVIGDGAYVVTLAWFTYTVTNSAGSVGVVLGTVATATLTTLLLGGALADRYSRRLLMIISDLGRFGCVTGLAAMTVIDSVSLELLVVVAALTGLFDGLFAPAFAGIVPLVVPQPALPSANALIGFMRAGGGIAGPVVGAGIYTTFGPAVVFGSNAASFLIAAALAIATRPRANPVTHGAGSNPFRDIAAGARYVLSVPILASIPVAAVALMVSDAPTQTLLPKLVAEQFHGGAGVLGAFTAAFGIGTAGGALLYGWLRPVRRRAVLVYAAWAGSHFICAALVLLPSANIAIGLCVVRGVLSGYGMALWETLLMQIVPPDKLSRVFSVDTFGCMGLLPVGFALATAVAPVGPASVLIAGGQLLAAVLMISLLGFRRIRAVQ